MEPRMDYSHVGDAALADLGRRGRAAVAAACAQRLLPLYLEYVARTGDGAGEMVRTGLDALWTELLSPGNAADLAGIADRLAEHVPNTLDGDPDDYSGLAEDALAAVVYAIWEYLGRDPASVAWACERAVTAIEERLSDAELARGEHPEVTAELARQQRDTAELIAAARADDLATAVRAVRQRATNDPIPAPVNGS